MASQRIAIMEMETRKFARVEDVFLQDNVDHRGILAKITGDKRFLDDNQYQTAFADLRQRCGTNLDLGFVARSVTGELRISDNSVTFCWPPEGNLGLLEQIRGKTMGTIIQKFPGEKFRT